LPRSRTFCRRTDRVRFRKPLDRLTMVLPSRGIVEPRRAFDVDDVERTHAGRYAQEASEGRLGAAVVPVDELLDVQASVAPDAERGAGPVVGLDQDVLHTARPYEVGASMRQTLTVKMEIVKIKGGFESPLPADRIIIPEISPAEGEVNFPFAPTTQRVIMTNWYAWPNNVTGRWALMGDENP